MIARLFLFLLGYMTLLAIPLTALGVVTWKRLRPHLEHRRLLKHMQRNAHALAANGHMTCIYCLEAVTSADCYEPHRGAFHNRCLQALLS
jgi:hypothetical protein